MLFLNEVAPDLWTATQPFRFLGLEIGCRMTIVRLPSRDLVVISPIPLKNGDRALLDSLGTVRHLIAPNRFHHLYFDSVQALYPDAIAWGVPGLDQKRPDLTFDKLLSQSGNFEGVLAYQPFEGLGAILPSGVHAPHETVFWHQPSGTLILTDLAFNFDETYPFMTRVAAQLVGSYGSLRPSRLEKWGTSDKTEVADSMRRVLDWDFDRVIPNHGSIVDTGGKAQLRAGYEWLLGRSL